MSLDAERERHRVFNRVRAALAPLRAAQQGETVAPVWDEDMAYCQPPEGFADPWDLFAHRFSELHGVALQGWEALRDFLGKQGVGHGYCDPALAEPLACDTLQLSTEFLADQVDDYEFGVTQASAVIAETGTIVLHDRQTSSRLGALAPWIHVAIVSRKRILPSVSSAIRQFKADPYVVFVSGPSKTADVEGILIEGVHGPGIQVACLVE